MNPCCCEGLTCDKTGPPKCMPSTTTTDKDTHNGENQTDKSIQDTNNTDKTLEKASKLRQSNANYKDNLILYKNKMKEKENALKDINITKELSNTKEKGESNDQLKDKVKLKKHQDDITHMAKVLSTKNYDSVIHQQIPKYGYTPSFSKKESLKLPKIEQKPNNAAQFN